MDFGRFVSIDEIKKGWSGEKKYRLEGRNGKMYFFRTTDISKAEQLRGEFELMKTLYEAGQPVPAPVEFDIDEAGNFAYTLTEFIDGRDGEVFVPSLPDEKQYRLGTEAGLTQRGLHSLTGKVFIPPPDLAPWEERYNEKIEIVARKYRECGVKIPDDERLFGIIEKNRHLLAGRPQVFQHGDFHTGNLIIKVENLGLRIYVVDWGRCGWGDPWEEFNRVVWCAGSSPEFARGRLDGYFGRKPPARFFSLMALYVSVNTLSSIYWAIPYGDEQVDIMQRQAKNVLSWYGKNDYIPVWYRRG